ncbi:MAG: trypsin-like peptidase domain-containing protein, partial [Erysipelotrichaceae bacterium]|nr:trypsin-like peptidase domain-containing protein [Erysipelotrichaceae bacterium]
MPETPNHKKGGFFKKHRTASLLTACFLISGVGSFGGFYLAQSMNPNSNNVSYQPVIRTASTNDNERVTGLSAKDVAAAAMNSVVEIRTESVQGGSFMRQYISEGAGSGVILSENGHIVTNHHVINGANKITVRTKDGTEYEATLLGSDAATDLAVLKIEATGLNPATLGDSSKLSVGDKAYAIGNPLGELGGTVTDGIISALDRELTIDGQSMRLLQTSAAINPGNSGGGLFNDAGELIGIVNAKSSGSDIEGLGFAIPINSAKQIIESLLNNGYVQNRPQLGITLVNITDEMTAYRNGVSTLGVYIDSVAPSSGAANANLQAKDRIISINGAEVKTSADIKKVIDQLNVGDVVK